MPFPKHFLWGAATSSYQIEGAVNVDGRGETIWDRYCHTLPTKIEKGDTGDVACDHYHRYQEDVALMRELGLQAYRFSIAWSRILPHGTGQVNERGLDFYDRLLDTLLEANIKPFATLYHWDLPQALQNRGGWANRESINWFTEYTQVVTHRFGDRVSGWITHNEPFIAAFVGNFYGSHPPGLTDLTTTYQVAHHLLLSHAAAVPVIRQNSSQSKIGIALNLTPADPASPRQEDVAAAWRQDGWINRWFLDPLYKGIYPADMLALVEDHFPPIDITEIKAVSVPIDFVGVNYYLRNVIAANPEARPLRLRQIIPENATLTAVGWEVYPQGLTELMVRLKNDYAIPSIYITENGAAFDDPLPLNGEIVDLNRIAYLDSHLTALEAAIAQGVPVDGYFVWSLLDNFEWGHGYSKRFGIVYVDYNTQQRIPKQSAWYYRNKIRQCMGK